MSTNEPITLEDEFNPTFNGTEKEQAWIKDALAEYYYDRMLTDVLYRVKGGKEATVYCCQAGPAQGLELIAAKVLRPRMFRAMKNDSLYRQGRVFRGADGKQILDDRSLRAIRNKTRHGRAIQTASWCRHEYGALQALYADGADVPKPLAGSHNAILMEYVGDRTFPAPILHGVTLEPDEARQLFDRVMRNIEILLARYMIHADLSAYNILYWQGEIRLIDLPQWVDAMNHPQAFELLLRDVTRVCQYFARQGVDSNPGEIARDLWQRLADGML